MWQNYLTVTLRALAKSKTYAFINIFGLALGLAACLLLLLYARYETTYDSWLPQADRVFQIQTFGVDPETGERLDMQAVTQPAAAAVAKDFPQVESASRLDVDDLLLLKDGRVVISENAGAVDAPFFDIIQVPFVRGERRQALRDTDSLAVSRSEAERLFGTIDVLGRTVTTIRDGARYDLRVTGVFEDLPRNSHMSFRMIRRYTSAEEAGCPWGCVNGNAYVKLKPGADVRAINDQMQAWERRNVPAEVAGVDLRKTYDWKLVNLKDIHLGPAQGGDRPGNDMRTITTFAVVALLILGIGCVNFVNLATARASQRAREVAVRKVLGARRSQLVMQFLGESMLLVAGAMLLALAMVELTLPAFSAFLEADLDISYWGSDSVLLPILLLTLLVGLAGGSYPALQLSRYQPAAVLKANKSTETQGSGRLRNVLVIAQFTISIALIVCTVIVYNQTLFARSVDPGYDREGLIAVGGMTDPQAENVRETLAREIARIDGVTDVAATSILLPDGPTFFSAVSVEGEAEPVKLGWYVAEPGFLETMRIKLLAGRALSRNHAKDSASISLESLDAFKQDSKRVEASGINVVVNRLAAQRLGYRTPAEAIGKQIRVPLLVEGSAPIPATIVGVTEDTRFRTVRDPVEPIIYHDAFRSYRWLAVRFRDSDPAVVREKIEAAWRRLVPELPFEAQLLDDEVAALYRADEARGRTFAGFAGLAILIACLGLFGLAAFTADRRTKEIGIRKVFGARVADIVRLLAWQFSKPVVIANLIAWPVAWWLMRDWLNSFDARISLGPGPFLLAGLIALVIALGTVSGHAIRIARLNPIHALRYE